MLFCIIFQSHFIIKYDSYFISMDKTCISWIVLNQFAENISCFVLPLFIRLCFIKRSIMVIRIYHTVKIKFYETIGYNHFSNFQWLINLYFLISLFNEYYSMIYMHESMWYYPLWASCFLFQCHVVCLFELPLIQKKCFQKW